MTQSLMVREDVPLPIANRVFGDERMSLIRALLPKDFTADDLADVEAFAVTCERTKLDFFARPPQIYAIRRYDRSQGRKVLSAQGSVDSFRLVAARTREYMGQDGPYWCGPDGEWKDVWLAKEPPTAAKVGVLRKGFPKPIYSVAVWARAAQYIDGKLGQFWASNGPEMLAKTAETNALKRAFPNDTHGLESASIEAEIQAGAADNARRYTEIYGSEETGTAFDLPPQRALNAAGQTVDTTSGEVLSEGGDHNDVPLPGTDVARPPTETQAAVGGRPVSPKMVESIDDPLYQLYADRAEQAAQLGVEFEVLVLPETVVKVTQLGRQLSAKINAAKMHAAQKQQEASAAAEQTAGSGQLI